MQSNSFNKNGHKKIGKQQRLHSIENKKLKNNKILDCLNFIQDFFIDGVWDHKKYYDCGASKITRHAVDPKLDLYDALCRVICLDIEATCASVFNFQTISNKIIIQNFMFGLNCPKDPKEVKKSYDFIINPDNASHLIIKYINIFIDNKSKEKVKKSIFGYISRHKFQNLIRYSEAFIDYVDILKEDYTENFFESLFGESLLIKLSVLNQVGSSFINTPNECNYEEFINVAIDCMDLIKEMKKNLKKRLNEENKENKENLMDILKQYIHDQNILAEFSEIQLLLYSVCQLTRDLKLISKWNDENLILNSVNVDCALPNISAHAESKVITFIINNLHFIDKAQNILIGCSKLCCLLCEVFILIIGKKYNIKFEHRRVCIENCMMGGDTLLEIKGMLQFFIKIFKFI